MADKPKAKSKSQVYQDLADATSLKRKDVAVLFDELSKLIKLEVGKKGPGIFNLPGLLKIKRVEKPATKARPGINPATREPITIKAKPKRTVIRAVPLKALKEMVK